jgi:hypothetical protein
MEQAFIERPTSSEWQNLTLRSLCAEHLVSLAQRADTMARYPSGKGGASKPLCVGSSPARATSMFSRSQRI